MVMTVQASRLWDRSKRRKPFDQMNRPLIIMPVDGIGEIVAGDDLAAIICAGLDRADLVIEPGDILVVAQKIVSKAEGRIVDLRSVEPSSIAHDLADITGKDAALIETVLRESQNVMRAKANVLVVRHTLGLVMANAGVDRSNVPQPEGGDQVLLLPIDPDHSAETLRTKIAQQIGCDVGIIISDSFGRAWRNGVVNVAIGTAGIASLVDRRGDADREGRKLLVTEVAHADALAAAAGIVMGEGAEGCPVVLVRGAPMFQPVNPAASLIRPITLDMFQ
jgi:coenzyme F420-0:L-glutamate ligase / coenzyme F420-1:gamma-L-glutamate ligase